MISNSYSILREVWTMEQEITKKRIGIRRKIIFLNLGSAIIAFVALFFIINMWSSRTIRNSIKENIQTLSREYANEINTEWSRSYKTTKTLKLVFETLMEDNVERAYLGNLMAKTLLNENLIYGLSLSFESNVFDGKDRYFKNTRYGDKRGRFSLFISKTDKNELLYQNLAINCETEDWYKICKMSKQSYLSPPHFYDVNGRGIMMMTFSFPFIKNGEVMGVLSADIRLDKYIERIKKIQPYETGYASIYREDGTVVCDQSIQYIGSHIKTKPFLKEAMGSHFDDYYDALSHNKQGVFAGKTLTVATSPFQIAGVGIGGNFNLTIAVESDKGFEDVSRMNRYLLAILLFFVIGSIVTSYLFAYKLSKPIVMLERVINDLHKGEGDLTTQIKVESSDEVGLIANSLNGFVSFLNNIISVVKTNTYNLENVSNNLASSSEETQAAVEQINSNLEVASGNIDKLFESMSHATTAGYQVQESMTSMQAQIEEQTASVNQSSSAIEEMSASIKNVFYSAEDKLQIAEKLEAQALNGFEKMDATVEKAVLMQSSIQAIQDFLTVIDSVSSQTSLLSMNAAIEAAHAGDAGKGFAVVADEIRKLAESTSSSSGQIDKSVRDIIRQIEESANEVLTAKDQFEELVNGIKTITNSMAETKATMTELSSGSEQVVEALANMVETGNVLLQNSKLVTDATENNSNAIKSMGEATEESQKNLLEISQGMKEIRRMGIIVRDAGIDNSEGVKKVRSIVETFKTDDSTIKEENK